MTTPNVANPQVGATAVASSPMNSNWFSGVGDFISTGLDGWMKYEQIQALKDSGNLGQVELSTTVETPNPNTNQTFVDPQQAAQAQQQANKGFTQKAGDMLQTGAGLVAAAVVGVGVLVWLTRK